MASLSVPSEPLFTFGGKKPEKKPESTRFYACELKWNAWHCTPTAQKTWPPANDSLATSLVPIDSWVPVFFDPLILSGKLRKPVILKKD